MKFSLRTKTIFLIVIIAIIFSATGIIVSSIFINRIIDDIYRNKADEIAHTVAVVIDGEQMAVLKDSLLKIYNNTENRVTSEEWGSPEFNEYIARFSGLEETAEFQHILGQLRSIQDVNDVDCIYLSVIDAPSEGFLYLIDAALEDPCPPGCLDPVYEENRELLTNPERGFPPYITNTDPYGWLVTAGAPVYDSNHNVVGYAMVDISMDALRSQQRNFTITLSILLLILTIIICAGSIFAVSRFIIRPVNMLSNAAEHYTAGNETREIDTLRIKTGDEIQSLYNSIKQMIHDINGYIDNLMKTSQELTQTRIKADQMDELAHKDALTGVGSKLAYDNQMKELTDEIRQGNPVFGIVMIDLNNLKYLNDTYGHEKGNLAIIKICSMVCEVFAHSPVYRIGGDEFVVILKGRDYENAQELIQQFEQNMAQLEGRPWEKVSAAVGYALYEGEDNADEVFRKADHMMYENKKEMKGLN